MRALVGFCVIAIAAFMVFRVSSAPEHPVESAEEIAPETVVIQLGLPSKLEYIEIAPEFPNPGVLGQDLFISPSERQARREGDAFIDEFAGRPCRTGGGGSSFFGPEQQRADGGSETDAIDVPPLLEIVAVGRMAMPTGELMVSTGDDFGGRAEAVTLAAPGVYTYVHLVSRSGLAESVLFAQLMLVENEPPVRWIDFPQLAIPANESYSGWIGSPTSSVDWFPQNGAASQETVESHRWQLVDQMLTSGDCRWFEVGDLPATAVLFLAANRSVPAAAGYGADGRLSAITWLINADGWSSAGLPGDISALGP